VISAKSIQKFLQAPPSLVEDSDTSVTSKDTDGETADDEVREVSEHGDSAFEDDSDLFDEEDAEAPPRFCVHPTLPRSAHIDTHIPTNPNACRTHHACPALLFTTPPSPPHRKKAKAAPKPPAQKQKKAPRAKVRRKPKKTKFSSGGKKSRADSERGIAFPDDSEPDLSDVGMGGESSADDASSSDSDALHDINAEGVSNMQWGEHSLPHLSHLSHPSSLA
jgi:hypothetical protein